MCSWARQERPHSLSDGRGHPFPVGHQNSACGGGCRVSRGVGSGTAFELCCADAHPSLSGSSLPRRDSITSRVGRHRERFPQLRRLSRRSQMSSCGIRRSQLSEIALPSHQSLKDQHVRLTKAEMELRMFEVSFENSHFILSNKYSGCFPCHNRTSSLCMFESTPAEYPARRASVGLGAALSGTLLSHESVAGALPAPAVLRSRGAGVSLQGVAAEGRKAWAPGLRLQKRTPLRLVLRDWLV